VYTETDVDVLLWRFTRIHPTLRVIFCKVGKSDVRFMWSLNWTVLHRHDVCLYLLILKIWYTFEINSHLNSILIHYPLYVLVCPVIHFQSLSSQTIPNGVWFVVASTKLYEIACRNFKSTLFRIVTPYWWIEMYQRFFWNLLPPYTLPTAVGVSIMLVNTYLPGCTESHDRTLYYTFSPA